jgi:tetratricopeptide (TPR) repeat protein
MSSDKSAKWGIGQRRDAEKKPASTTSVPHVPRPRVSVAQPQRRFDSGAVGGAGRVSTDRDSRLGRRIAFGVIAITAAIFGSNYAGLWQSDGQRAARQEIERKQPGPVKEALDKQRIAMERREADRVQSEKIAREREAQRKSADDAAARRAREEAAKAKAKEEGKPPPAPTRPNLAETDCQMSKPLSVIVPACSAIIAQHNDYADAYFIRAWALRERNQGERALTDFGRAIQLQPTQQPAYYSQRALTYVRLRDFDRALADYNKAIELNPRSPSFRNDRGAAYLDLKDYSSAFDDFNRAIELDPRYAVPYNNRARAHVLGKGDHASAIADLDRAVELSPKYALAFENRGLSHLELKDLAKALADFNTAIEITPRSARALNARGVVYERQGKRDLAAADYRRALDADQNFTTARENLTRLGEKP